MKTHLHTSNLSAAAVVALPRTNGHPVITNGNVYGILADRAVAGSHHRLHNAVVTFNSTDTDGPSITLSGYTRRYHPLQLAQQALIQALQEPAILLALGVKSSPQIKLNVEVI